MGVAPASLRRLATRIQGSKPRAAGAMTEADARALLQDCSGFGGLEAWIAGRCWKVAPDGWVVTGELQGWQFRLVVVACGLRISASAPGGGDPAVWIVTG